MRVKPIFGVTGPLLRYLRSIRFYRISGRLIWTHHGMKKRVLLFSPQPASTISILCCLSYECRHKTSFLGLPKGSVCKGLFAAGQHHHLSCPPETYCVHSPASITSSVQSHHETIDLRLLQQTSDESHGLTSLPPS